ncbi:hypothetical protein BU14_2638s0001 [Porphyra umbilicalis]|uniref:L-rhamnose mutarotase n=1 Tax=Porphyra umbilicalis TaxID=2786 RepID=A0A1X6NJJ5_PORUM|nr:hypothetical protein BU14_2638s0001 [Porphyra umbilicalis]|eukprot:OSX68523.1 hypothetical protein BU14_2638s0001 [Porphyra umbilicalis]
MASAPSPGKPMRMGMTLDIKPGMLAEYKAHHDNSWPEVESALRSVGMRNLSLWAYGNRMFYYAEYVGDTPFDEAMATYAKMPRVSEWEALMHKYQEKIPAADGDTADTAAADVWWRPCTQVYHLD